MDTDGDAAGAHRRPPTSSDAASDGAAETQAKPGHTRRWVLAGGGAAVIAAAAGVGVGFVQPVPERHTPRRPPVALTAAVTDERALLASVTAALHARPRQRAVLVQLRRDHAAHLRALLAAVDAYPRSVPTARPSGSTSAGQAVDAAALRAAELRAATVAATRAGRLDGPDAALLASISACETTHAVLLETTGVS